MKTMTCKQLGGACDVEFHDETFEGMVGQSKKHGMEMFEKDDKAHIDIMNKMKEGMNDPEAMNKWMEERKNEFEALPES